LAKCNAHCRRKVQGHLLETHRGNERGGTEEISVLLEQKYREESKREHDVVVLKVAVVDGDQRGLKDNRSKSDSL
jgi:hypothetical protein